MGGDCENYGGGLKSRCQKLWGGANFCAAGEFFCDSPSFLAKNRSKWGGTPQNPPPPSEMGGSRFQNRPPPSGEPMGGKSFAPPHFPRPWGGNRKVLPPIAMGGECHLCFGTSPSQCVFIHIYIYMHFAYIFARILARTKKCICIFGKCICILGNFDRYFRKCICNFGKSDRFYKGNPVFEGSKAKKNRLRRFLEHFSST